MAIKGSSSDEEEEDARNSSNDEKEPMNPNLYKQVKKMNNCLKEINSMGYMIFLKDEQFYLVVIVCRVSRSAAHGKRILCRVPVVCRELHLRHTAKGSFAVCPSFTNIQFPVVE